MKSKTMNNESTDITVISQGVKIEGQVSSDGSIRLDGMIRGDVSCKGDVTIGEQGEVFGKVEAVIITIGGKVEGMINAKEKLMLESKSNLKGDIFTKILVVEAGARFDGKSNMQQTRDSSDPSKVTS